MTVANTTFSNSFTGDAATTAFSFTWRLVEDASVAVYVAGVKKTLGVDYTLATNRLTTGLGGTVTFLAAPANGAAIVIQRESDQLQSNNLQNNQAMPPSTVMAMIDKLTCLLQDALRTFTSADTTIAAGQTYTFPHSLGKIPSHVQLALVCQVAEANYAIGDVIDLDLIQAASGAFATVQRDITNVYVRTGPAGVSPVSVVNKSSGGASTITPFANWKLRVYAS